MTGIHSYGVSGFIRGNDVTRAHPLLRAGLLAVGMLLAAIVTVAAQGPTPADEAFWESIKSSSNVAEYRAYLEAFPRGFYADRARARIAELDGSATNVPPAPGAGTIPFTPPTPGPEKGPGYGPAPVSPGGSVLISYAVIREVQERLYGLNYSIKVINGQLSKETRDAISAWQQVVKRPVTGDMTEEDLEFLRSAKAITVWGAIAFEARGAYGIVWSRSSRQDAENDSLAECRKYAAGNAKNCDPFTLIDSQCGAMSYYSGSAGGRTHWGSFVVRRATLDEAKEDAVEECRRQARVPRTCQLRVSFCADGSHR